MVLGWWKVGGEEGQQRLIAEEEDGMRSKQRKNFLRDV